MKIYFVADVRVLVDGKDYSIERISGANYEPNLIKRTAEDRTRKQEPDKKISSVIIFRKEMDLEEYKKEIGGTPTWLKGLPNEE